MATKNLELATESLEENSISTNHAEVIETVISSLDSEQTAMVSHSEKGSLWKFNYGSVEVFVQITGETDEDLLTVWSCVLKLPAKDEPALMRKLLEMNWENTLETCFGIMNNQVVVLSQRTMADLSPGEISRAVTLVANIADDNDDILQAEFGF